MHEQVSEARINELRRWFDGDHRERQKLETERDQYLKTLLLLRSAAASSEDGTLQAIDVERIINNVVPNG